MRLSQASTLKIAFISIGLRVRVNSRKVPWSRRCFHYVQSQCFAKPKVSIGSMTDEFMLLLVLFSGSGCSANSWSYGYNLEPFHCTQSSSGNICWIKLLPFELEMFAKPWRGIKMLSSVPHCLVWRWLMNLSFLSCMFCEVVFMFVRRLDFPAEKAYLPFH